MKLFLTVVHVTTCLLLVVVVLLQRGKGAEIGAVFGGGASSTVFGSRGAGIFLTKITTAAAITFMCTSLALAYMATQRRATFDEIRLNVGALRGLTDRQMAQLAEDAGYSWADDNVGP